MTEKDGEKGNLCEHKMQLSETCLECEIKELRTRVAEQTAQHEEDKTWWMKKAEELQNRLSTVEKEVEEARQNLLHGLDTDKEKDKDLALVHLVAKTLNGFYWRDKKIQALLNASEGMEKALEQYARIEYYSFLCDPMGQQTDPTAKAKQALADFRAVKENMEKGAANV